MTNAYQISLVMLNAYVKQGQEYLAAEAESEVA